MKVRYNTMPNRAPGAYTVWLIAITPLPWSVGYIRASDDARWVTRRREDGEPSASLPRRSDAAAYLAIVGGWCKCRHRHHHTIIASPKSPRPQRSPCWHSAVLHGPNQTTRLQVAISAFQQGICTGLRAGRAIDPRHPIGVTYVGSGARAAFECASTVPGRLLPPGIRFVPWGS
jgi:hypothetical protein